MATGTINANDDTGWVNVTTGLYSRVKNGLCCIIGNDITIQSGAVRSFALPEKAKPKYAINPFCRSGTNILQCWIAADSMYISFDPGGTTRQHATVFATYFVDN